ncbi:MAG TPA: DNA recombination protein RmuC [Candidatus Saccharimonadales bacterium]|nr:DNA recombination protein RmuC [Candidatus Saccharimonadales bacterium]
MNSSLTITLFAIILSVIVIIYFLNKKLTELKKPDTDSNLLEWLKSMQASIDKNSESTTRTLQENSKQLNDRLDKAASVIRDVGVEVGQMSEIGRSMKELQDFLKSPKLRGNIGEHILKDLITQIFPKNSFNLQYEFKSGEKVDAAIKTDAGILPIDAKFPMENFQKMGKAKTEDEINTYRKEFTRDIKKHIDSIAKKYILPSEGTMDFALMYVPSESVFYEIVNIEEISEYARTKRIYVVSPSTLYAHLQTILLSFEGKKIETESRQVFQLLRALQIDYEKVNESLDLLGKHIGNSSNTYMNVNKGFIGMGQKLSSAKDLSSEIKKEITQTSKE